MQSITADGSNKSPVPSINPWHLARRGKHEIASAISGTDKFLLRGMLMTYGKWRRLWLLLIGVTLIYKIQLNRKLELYISLGLKTRPIKAHDVLLFPSRVDIL